MGNKGYKVEYVPPQDNAAILQGLFNQVKERLAATLTDGVINPDSQEVMQKNNSYYYKIILNNDNGNILFRYDDNIPEFTSFEDYMHSSSSDRGDLDISIKIITPSHEDEVYKLTWQRLKDTETPDVNFSSEKDHGEIYARKYIGISLLNPDESDIEFIYERVLDLWNQIRILMDKAASSKEN